MKPFTFLAPAGLDETVALLAEHGPDARVIAGGQSLLLAMKDRLARPSVLVSIAGVPEVRDTRYTDSGELEIGAATTYSGLVASSFDGWHAQISAVAGDLADQPVRNMGTIGGALCQADPRFDMPALAVGLDASLVLASTSGLRTVPAGDFFGTDGGTTLAPGEILVTVRFPVLDRFSGVAFEKFRKRVFDAALVSAVCAVRLAGDGTVSERRIAVGAVAPRPILVAEAGRAAADEILPESAATTPLRRYQRELVDLLTRRAVSRALDQARS